MPEISQRLLERRVLILAPTGRDAPLARELLAEQGIYSFACADLSHLVGELTRGVGAILVSEEAIPKQADL